MSTGSTIRKRLQHRNFEKRAHERPIQHNHILSPEHPRAHRERRHRHPGDSAPVRVGQHAGARPRRLPLPRLPDGIPHHLEEPRREDQGRRHRRGQDRPHRRPAESDRTHGRTRRQASPQRRLRVQAREDRLQPALRRRRHPVRGSYAGNREEPCVDTGHLGALRRGVQHLQVHRGLHRGQRGVRPRRGQLPYRRPQGDRRTAARLHRRQRRLRHRRGN